MASKIASYYFKDYEGWDAATRALYREVGSSDNDSFYTYNSDYTGYYIKIWDNCSDPRLAGQICKANGGESY